MKQNLTRDFIAIDTNVFRHLLNPQDNPDNHIDSLLRSLMEDNIKPLLDDRGKIWREYSYQIPKLIKRTLDNPYVSKSLQFYLERGNHVTKSVDYADGLMQAISEIMTGKDESDTVDKTFVYLALSMQRILITNDKKHIVNRREELLKIVENDAEIYTSKGAYDIVHQNDTYQDTGEAT